MPSPRILPALLLLLTTCAITTRAQTPRSSAPCLIERYQGYGAAQDQLIARSLQQYELLKPLATQLRLRGDSLYAANQSLHRVITYQDSARWQAGRQLTIQRMLYRDADNKARTWKARAKARWWANVGLGALALLLGAAAVR